MFRSLDQIKKQRTALSINQKELAQKAGVSQSYVAKLEAGKLQPTYALATRIFQTLEQLQAHKELKAKELMNAKLVMAKITDHLQALISLMKEENVSQLPIIDDHKICGMVSENTIINIILANPSKAKAITAQEIMEEAPPIISGEVGFRSIVELIKENPILLVAEKGVIKGIISKTDVLEKI